MDGYHVALFFHLVALVAASAASAIVHLAGARGSRAATVSEVRQWHALAGMTARTFPLALLALFATGGYMVAARHGWTWDTGWVEAGIAGVIVLFASGAVIGGRSRAAGRALAGLADGPTAGRPPVLPRDPVVSALSWANTGVAMAVVFVMATKPSLAASLIVLAIGAAAGVMLALSPKRSHAPGRDSVELSAG